MTHSIPGHPRCGRPAVPCRTSGCIAPRLVSPREVVLPAVRMIQDQAFRVERSRGGNPPCVAGPPDDAGIPGLMIVGGPPAGFIMT